MASETYGYERALPGISFEDAVARVTGCLSSEGFGVLTEIDVQATFKKKLNLPFRRYTILGACNPELAHRALLAEPQIGLLLPCNVVVQEQEQEQGIRISIASPRAMFRLTDNPRLEPVVQEAETRVRKVLEELG